MDTSSTQAIFTNDQFITWRKLCDFSQYRKEAFGSRKNQLVCERKGEQVKATDERYISACDWIVSIFLQETMPDNIKTLPDWLNRAKQSLAVVIDISVDEYSEHYDIYSLMFLTEAISVIEYCIREYEWD